MPNTVRLAECAVKSLFCQHALTNTTAMETDEGPEGLCDSGRHSKRAGRQRTGWAKPKGDTAFDIKRKQTVPFHVQEFMCVHGQ